jgi:aspartate 1-decarboxylase
LLISVLKSKIAYAKVTSTDLFYEGSITIDEDIMENAQILAYEKVQIVNVNNGERFSTYVIPGKRKSNIFALNGPAARKCAINDEIHVLSYILIDPNRDSFAPINIRL